MQSDTIALNKFSLHEMFNVLVETLLLNFMAILAATVTVLLNYSIPHSGENNLSILFISIRVD